ncbi:MAG TPA: UDP-N-acetylmuramate dehydrogenase [Vicinamibacterales bacterium]|nr:UDP-N-acetylmuramate dehydrogenase [Vicinamibacterales bacterium]
MTGRSGEAFDASLVEAFGRDRVGRDVRLAPLTTFKVGGPADWLIETRSDAELQQALRLARQAGVPVTMLGGGSNVLVGDRGVRGLVIRPRGGSIVEERPGRLRAAAAVTINGLVRWTVGRGLAGLEAWAGTPGTVGGGIYGNAHYGGRLLGDLVEEVRVVGPGGDLHDLPQAAMEFGYDRSRLQRSGEVLLSAVFRVVPGDSERLRATARQSLAFRKRTQPLESPSAGCIFQNPDPAVDRVPAGLPPSAGALVDRAGLKGRMVGGARVSPTHGNFIVNDGRASAADIRALVELCRHEVRERFGVTLKDEIVCVGEF